MKFWDASAIVPLLMTESPTPSCCRLLLRIRQCSYGGGRRWNARRRFPASNEKACSTKRRPRSIRPIETACGGWHEVDPNDGVREAAIRFLRVHPLRAADSLQLGAAFIAAERRPASLAVITLDERLAAAARKEGFELILG